VQADPGTVAFGYSAPCQAVIIQQRSVNSLAQNVLPFPFCFTLITMNTTKKLVVLSTTLAAVLGLACNAFAAAPAETLSSGVKIVHSVDGTGPQPKASDTVKVHYRGTLADGKEFDSSYKRGTPASFPLSRVVPCWTEGMQKIKVGGKATLTCPPATAYGDRGAGGVVPPNATLTFDVELLAIEK
jgi:FKBP-type peptidyl-prolyl cis-trans isomerase FkpA